MNKTHILLIIVLLLFSCKKQEKKEDCLEKFQDLYLKRYSLWFHFESTIEEMEYENFSFEKYQKEKDILGDSLSIFIDCAIKQNKEKEILYLYKMKQLYLSGKLGETKAFLKTVDRKIVKEDIYYQLSLYSTLCKELNEDKIPIEEYKLLLKQYSPTLNPAYEERAIELFLLYLVTDDLYEFRKKLQNKYSNSSSILPEHLNDRKKVIENIMMRGDMLIFD